VHREELDHLHTPAAIRERLAAGPNASYLRDWVYGGIDGAVTTFAVVAGVVGAGLQEEIIVVLGLANLAGDGFSMAAGNWSGTRSEQHELEHLHAMELRHIATDPAGEEAEVREIFRLKGFDGEVLESVVEHIVSDRERWVSTMLVEEHGLPTVMRSAWKASSATFGAFVLCGAVPLLPYLLGASASFGLASASTAAVFFSIGSLQSRWSPRPWWRCGLSTLAVGSSAALVAWLVGRALAPVVAG
jgi:VIT1/CCC1 family predicted Fe2+/Mn2+ transporter